MEKYRIAICEDEEKERIQLKENLKMRQKWKRFVMHVEK